MFFGSSRKAIGQDAERMVVRALRKKKWDILAVNYACRFGEIDIIASDGKFVCFIEVKGRGENSFFAPREAVTPTKQKRIIKTAMHYLSSYPSELQPRFDVAEVYFSERNRIEYIENAFDATNESFI